MDSCIYVGRVDHRRYRPLEHGFGYPIFMLYLDLDELSRLRSRRILGRSRMAPLSFRRQDHISNSAPTLADAVRELVNEKTGIRPTGPIRLLTGLRCFGYYFSPLNLYYCFDPEGRAVEQIVAEVSNTPWREVHYYVLWQGNRTGGSEELAFSHPKGFHVSPFMGMDLQYDWHLNQPGSRCTVQITNRHDDDMVFDARLALERRQLNRLQLLRLLLRYPCMSGRIALAIYSQAFRLWRKKCPFYPHPNHPR